jgi:hypothetical protein
MKKIMPGALKKVHKQRLGKKIGLESGRDKAQEKNIQLEQTTTPTHSLPQSTQLNLKRQKLHKRYNWSKLLLQHIQCLSNSSITVPKKGKNEVKYKRSTLCYNITTQRHQHPAGKLDLI